MCEMNSTTEWDSAAGFESAEEVAEFIRQVMAYDEPNALLQALDAIVRATGITKVANTTGVSRRHLYRALSKEGNPTVETTQKILAAFGLQLTVAPITPAL